MLDQYGALLALDRTLVDRAKAQWYTMNLHGLQDSFVRDFVPAVVPDVAAAQTAAARIGATQMAADTGERSSVVPGAFAGTAADGRSLPGLLAQPLIGTFVNLAGGMPPDEAMARGFASMDAVLTTTVQDAARQAAQVALVADATITYYVRMVEPGACDKCIILSGRRYKWSTQFERHDHCHCSMAPETVTFNIPTPEELFAAMTPAERAAAFGVNNARAIADGADMFRVVNATHGRSGMRTIIPDGMGNRYAGTLVGTRNGNARLVPESIYRIAAGDRDEARRLLQLHGYVTPSSRRISDRRIANDRHAAEVEQQRRAAAEKVARDAEAARVEAERVAAEAKAAAKADRARIKAEAAQAKADAAAAKAKAGHGDFRK